MSREAVLAETRENRLSERQEQHLRLNKPLFRWERS